MDHEYNELVSQLLTSMAESANSIWGKFSSELNFPWTSPDFKQLHNLCTVSMRLQVKHPFNGGLEGLRQLTHLLLGGHPRSSPSFLPASSLLSQQPLFLRFLPNFFAAAPSFSAFPPNHPAFSGRRCWHASSLQNHQSCQQSDYPAAVRQCGKFAQKLVPMHWMKNS